MIWLKSEKNEINLKWTRTKKNQEKGKSFLAKKKKKNQNDKINLTM